MRFPGTESLLTVFPLLFKRHIVANSDTGYDRSLSYVVGLRQSFLGTLGVKSVSNVVAHVCLLEVP